MIEIERLHTYLPKFCDAAVLVVGDVMLDEFIWGSVSRISPEAPVPVIDVLSESLRLGGAANVVHNIRSLGGRAKICSVIGNDATGTKLVQALRSLDVPADGLLIDSTRPTTLKTRIIAHHQQVARLDREVRDDLNPALAAQFIEMITATLPSVNAVIIEDYGKGVVTAALIQDIVAAANAAHKIVAVDPKTQHFDLYRGVSIIKPNLRETAAAVQMTIRTHDDLLAAGARLLEKLACQYVLITRGEEGMSLFDGQRRIATHVPAVAQEVYDVTGAGDTVIAALTLALAIGSEPIDAVLIANAAAGVVVGKVGTATVNQEELSAELIAMINRKLNIVQESFA